MSMFFSTSSSVVAPGSLSSFQYRATTAEPLPIDEEELQHEPAEPEIRLTTAALAQRLADERAAGFAEAELNLRQEYERKANLQIAKISEALSDFAREQKSYFARVEAELVQLALAIAGKILHREAQVDPLLLAAIVHLALGQLKDGSAATIRVRPEETVKWQNYIKSQPTQLTVNILEDLELQHGDCILETELGTVNFGLDAQLKEVERGFLDVLAQKPKV